MPPSEFHALLPGSGIYRGILIGSLVVSFALWLRYAQKDRRLLAVYLGGVLGGFTGAKIVFILAEGWLYWGSPEFWFVIASGKTIVGALLGGYAGVEISKASVGYQKATGDWFALVVPLSVASGRIGCLVSGCCQGIPFGNGTWPAAMVEMGFNLLIFTILFPLRHSPRLSNQLFHIYIMAYATFRFFHEFMRATEKPFMGFSGYQIAAAALLIFGGVRFAQRGGRHFKKGTP